MLVRYQQHLTANGLVPDDITTFCFNSITANDWKSFVDHPESIALISSTGDITAQPPPNTRLDSNFKVTYSPADSFKKSIKRDVSLFATFKDGKYWDTCHRNTLDIARAQDAVEVLDLTIILQLLTTRRFFNKR